jgi:hypothetical protein
MRSAFLPWRARNFADFPNSARGLFRSRKKLSSADFSEAVCVNLALAVPVSSRKENFDGKANDSVGGSAAAGRVIFISARRRGRGPAPQLLSLRYVKVPGGSCPAGSRCGLRSRPGALIPLPACGFKKFSTKFWLLLGIFVLQFLSYFAG